MQQIKGSGGGGMDGRSGNDAEISCKTCQKRVNGSKGSYLEDDCGEFDAGGGKFVDEGGGTGSW
jgi:hypothetical protein